MINDMRILNEGDHKNWVYKVLKNIAEYRIYLVPHIRS